MHLYEIMTPEVEGIDPAAALRQTATTMPRLKLSSLPVCEGERLIGTLTDRDLTVRAVTEECNPSTTPRRGAITSGLASCFADQGSSDAQEAMECYQMRRVPMLSRDKRLVGMVSLSDLAMRSDTPTQAGETLQHVAALLEARCEPDHRAPRCTSRRRGHGWWARPGIIPATASAVSEGADQDMRERRRGREHQAGFWHDVRE
jgi:CBS domain-containing protein